MAKVERILQWRAVALAAERSWTAAGCCTEFQVIPGIPGCAAVGDWANWGCERPIRLREIYNAPAVGFQLDACPGIDGRRGRRAMVLSKFDKLFAR